MSLEALAEALSATGLVQDVQVDEGFVHGEAVLAATGDEITVNVDPDPDEEGIAVDVEALVAQCRNLLAVTAEEVTRIVTEVADEIEEALAEEGIEKLAELRSDLELVSAIALPDAGALVFLATEQFADKGVLVFLDEDHEVTEIQLEGMGGGCVDCDCGSEHGDEGLTSVEELRDTITEAN